MVVCVDGSARRKRIQKFVCVLVRFSQTLPALRASLNNPRKKLIQVPKFKPTGKSSAHASSLLVRRRCNGLWLAAVAHGYSHYTPSGCTPETTRSKALVSSKHTLDAYRPQMPRINDSFTCKTPDSPNKCRLQQPQNMFQVHVCWGQCSSIARGHVAVTMLQIQLNSDHNHRESQASSRTTKTKNVLRTIYMII